MMTPGDKLEAVARRMAAKKMGLVKDPFGKELPFDLWSQCLGSAHVFLIEVERDAALMDEIEAEMNEELDDLRCGKD